MCITYIVNGFLHQLTYFLINHYYLIQKLSPFATYEKNYENKKSVTEVTDSILHPKDVRKFS